ncbi:MAG: hypothetical protein RMK94_12450 [Armatimonadota bacterium]|nr:hypothetical protein [Armatimonadota bacterium]
MFAIPLRYLFDALREPCSYPRWTIAISVTPERPMIGDNAIELQVKFQNGEIVGIELV